MKLTIHRGTKEVGGTCIEISSGRSRLVMDLGMPLGEGFRPEDVRPSVPGLFDGSPPPDAIALSHAHQDHSGLVHLARPEIPVCLTQGTSKMLLAASIFTRQPGLRRRPTIHLIPGIPTTIGDLRITALSVDHSAFDSAALLVEGGDRRILYSGDFRLHGRKPGMARRLLDHVRRHPVDVLLLEGTHVGSSRPEQLSEQGLEQQIVGHVKAAKGLVLAAFSPLNVDRLVTYYRASVRAGRTFVVDSYSAFVLHLAAGQCRVPCPNIRGGIRVAFPKPGACRRSVPNKIFELFRRSEIHLSEVLGTPERHLMIFRESLLGDPLPAGATLLYSYWQGYLNDNRGQQLKDRLAQAKIPLILAHASGHIHPESLADFVRAVSPKRLTPIHTFHRQGFSSMWDTVQFPEDGECVNL